MARNRKSPGKTDANPWDDLPPDVQEMLTSILPLATDSTVVGQFPLSRDERGKARAMPGLPPSLQQRLAHAESEFTIGDTVQLLATAVCRLALLSREYDFLETITDKLTHCLHDSLDLIADVNDSDEEDDEDDDAAAIPRPCSTEVYRLKIELIESKPPIWRRIEVGDCTLDELHEHIQAAMGWTNSHLHQFYVGKQIFGDPDMLDEGFGPSIHDSTETWLSELVGERRAKFKFEYEYDFGDGWRHRITVEKRTAADPAVEYPRCLEGERACPPEDCGGVYGYSHLLEVLANPADEEYDELREWIGDKFNPSDFDPAATTQAMRAGAPNLFDPFE